MRDKNLKESSKSSQKQPSVSDTESVRQKKVAKRREDMPSKYRKLYDRVSNGTASKLEAIKSQCLECVYWQPEEVAKCTALACPLYMYRPYKEQPVKSLTQPLPAEMGVDLDEEAKV